MPQERQPTTTQPNVTTRTNDRKKKPLVYQSSLEQFLKPIPPGGIKKNTFTTPLNKRKHHTTDVNELAEGPIKKQKRSSNPQTIQKNYEADPGMDASTPIVITDGSEDEIWDGDTLCNSASTNRTFVANLEKTPFNPKSKFALEQLNDSDHTPPTTPTTSRAVSASDTPIPSSRCRNTSPIIPSSQAHERTSPLVIPLDIEEPQEPQVSGPLLRLPKQTIAEEIIPSSQSQYLLPYVISPHRKRRFTAEPTPPLRELIPCSQEPRQLDLVLLAREHGLGTDTTSMAGNGASTAPAPESMDDCPSQGSGECDGLSFPIQHDLGNERQPNGHATNNQPDGISVDHSGSLLAVRNSSFLERDTDSGSDDAELIGQESLPFSSPPSYDGNDSQYTYVEETCPSQILDFLVDLDQRVESQPQSDLMPTLQMDPQAEGGKTPNEEDKEIPDCSSLSLMTSSSQISTGLSSQYTFVEASVPSDIAEFLDELDSPSHFEG